MITGNSGWETAQMRQGAEAVCARQVQVQQQQIDLRMLLEGIKQARDAIGLKEPTVVQTAATASLSARRYNG